ncbi:MAG: hypothetical protein EXQ81_08230 [Thermoleophilia bacterium]|nr:hypothetical protein [Thermoleophilia bacterium]
MSEEEDGPEITTDARRFTGVGADAVRVNEGHDEIPIDVARLDPVEPRRIVVSRMTFSPPFPGKLLGKIERVWHGWVWSWSPPETRSS